PGQGFDLVHEGVDLIPTETVCHRYLLLRPQCVPMILPTAYGSKPPAQGVLAHAWPGVPPLGAGPALFFCAMSRSRVARTPGRVMRAPGAIAGAEPGSGEVWCGPGHRVVGRSKQIHQLR